MTANVIPPQSGGRRSTNIKKESTPGTPAAGAWETLRATGGSGVVGDVSTTESAELTGTSSLGLQDVIRTGEKANADYNFELSYAATANAPFEYFMESALGGEWGDDTANRLIPGTKVLTLSVEDIFNDISKVQSVQSAIVSSFQLNITAGELVTGSVSLMGATYNVGTPTAIAGTPTFSVANGNELTPDSGSVPSSAVVGATVRITASDDDSDIGYYKITAVSSNTVTVDGSLTNGSTKAMTVLYSSSSIQGATPSAASANEPFLAGDVLAVEITTDGGTTWRDSLDWGFRIPSMNITINNELAELREVTLTEAYAMRPVKRVVDVNVDYHLLDTYPMELLTAGTEIGIRVQMIDSMGTSAATGNKYIFTFPAVKTVAATAGDASLGSEMVGSWSLKALLNSSDVDVQVDRTDAT